jgi:hypothetical protein
VISEHPGLDRYLGQQIVLGIRPEHLSDATLAPSGSVIKLPIKRREEVGSEVTCTGRSAAPPHIAAGDADDIIRSRPSSPEWIRVTTIAVGETAPVAVEVDQLHSSTARPASRSGVSRSVTSWPGPR